MIVPFLMAPTINMDSGHKSRTSMIQGFLLNFERIIPARAVKNWGEVAIATSNLILIDVKMAIKAKDI